MLRSIAANSGFYENQQEARAKNCALPLIGSRTYRIAGTFTVALMAMVAIVPSACADESPLASDRPTKSNSPITVPDGRFQYEADTPLVTRAGIDQYTVDSVFKVGLSPSTDLELGITPLIADSAGAGIGDVTGRVKFNVFGNDSGAALAIVPYIKVPTATRRFGNGQTEGGVIVPLTVPLPSDFTVSLMTEIDSLKNTKNSGYHANFVNLLNLSHPLLGNFTLSGEIYSSISERNGGAPIYTTDYAISYLVTPNVQLDAGVNIGLSASAPDTQYYFGISQRF